MIAFFNKVRTAWRSVQCGVDIVQFGQHLGRLLLLAQLAEYRPGAGPRLAGGALVADVPLRPPQEHEGQGLAVPVTHRAPDGQGLLETGHRVLRPAQVQESPGQIVQSVIFTVRSVGFDKNVAGLPQAYWRFPLP